MGFSIQIYAVDLKSIAAVFASKNEALLKKIISSNLVRIRDINDWTDAEINAENALFEIFEGKISSGFGEIYANVMELICKELGEQLPSYEWQDLSMNWLMEINMEAELPIASLPLPSDFPYVLTVSNKNADEFVGNMKALYIEDENARAQAELWFQKLIMEKKDLVLYFY